MLRECLEYSTERDLERDQRLAERVTQRNCPPAPRGGETGRGKQETVSCSPIGRPIRCKRSVHDSPTLCHRTHRIHRLTKW